MLARVNRLNKNFQFRYVYSHGKAYGARMMTMLVCSAKLPDGLKIGISVSKKNGKAHLRNRLKRLMRESVRSLLPQLKTGYNIVLTASAKYDFSAGFSYEQVRTEVTNLMRRAGLVNPPPCD